MTGTITDAQVATLRAQLAQRFDEHQRMLQDLDLNGTDKVGYLTLVGAGFVAAVERHFEDPPARADVAAYVADVRGRSEGAARDLDTAVAERMLMGVFEEDPSFSDIDTSTLRQTQVLLLVALVADERFDDAELDRFMASIRQIAEESFE